MRSLLAALLLLCMLPGAALARRPVPTVTLAVRHYLNGQQGLTRTTWYTPTGYRTASGQWPRYGMVAAPPQVPFGSTMILPSVGIYSVADRGSAIYGAHVDVFLPWPGYRHIPDYVRGVYWIQAYG